MSKNTCRMIGLTVMIISVFLLFGGVFLKDTMKAQSTVALLIGAVILLVGFVFYKVLKSDE
ncbi:MAG: hypothetical protein IJR47_04760 [Clostridia bacterium]|nr:hypothetical protein [Clostridia bacterium]